jgi:DNA-binding IclR family transcriptional regulator
MTPRSTDQSPAAGDGSTRTVDRAFDLLDAVTERPLGVSLSELARTASLSPATASRLLSTLVKRGLVRRDEHGQYRPGLRLMQMAALVLRGEPLYELAGPHLAALAQATGETANLGVAVDEERALYLRQAAGDHRVQTASWTGRTIPRRGTAMGAALAGELEPGGYSISRGSLEPDITAVAAPVRDYDGTIIAALSIIAPSYRTDDGDVDRYGLLLVEHAGELSWGHDGGSRKG